MKTINVNRMESIEGGKPKGLCNGAAFTCGLGALFLETTFAIPVLFAVAAPLTAASCLSTLICQGL